MVDIAKSFSQTNVRSSGVKNLADAKSAGIIIAAKRLKRTVASPSKIKIHRQPARPPTPSIFRIAVARRPPNAPDSDAKNTGDRQLIPVVSI